MKPMIPDKASAQAVETVCRMALKAGGRALLVGGCVRDAILGLPVRELDLELYGIEPERLKSLLSESFRVDVVGEAFGVLKLHGLPIDVAIPRRESKRGLGHKGFEIMSDPSMSPVDAARRRDFTINSMAYDLLKDETIDPYNGRRDLEKRLLRHVGPQFSEDPLRVLRGMQFVARFELKAADETVELCRTITPEGLPPERIFEEWKKLVLLGVKPSLGLEFLRMAGWLRYYPELEALVGCLQEPEWHPEGDVWVHTGLCMDAFAARRIGDTAEDMVVGFAVLCHDFGKPVTTSMERGRLRSIGHTEEGEAPTRAFLARMSSDVSLANEVVALVREHLRPLDLFGNKAGDSAIRRLAARVGRIDRLVRVVRADQEGRGPKPPPTSEALEWLLERARLLEIEDSVPKPLVMGRHLVALGMKPGPSFKPVLDACYEAQLDGLFADAQGGIAWAKQKGLL